MKKTLTVLLILSFTVPLLFAGGGTDRGTTQGGAVDMSVTRRVPQGEPVVRIDLAGYERAEIEIQWQPAPNHSMANTGNPVLVQDLTNKLQAWIRKYPNVKVVPIGTTMNINDNMTRLRLTAAQGNAPDLSGVDSFMMPPFKEFARDLSDLAVEYGLDVNDYFPFMREEIMDGNQLKALWYTTDVRGIYYRKDLVPRPPTNADEIISIGQSLIPRVPIPFLFQGARNEGSPTFAWGFYWSQGADIIDSRGNMGFESGPGYNAMLEVLSFVRRTIDTGISPRTVVELGSDANMYGHIQNGDVGMFIASSSAITQLRVIMGQENFDNLWGFAPYPTMRAGQRSTGMAGGWTYMVFSQEELKRRLAFELAWDIVVSDSASESYCLAGGWLPPRQSLYQVFNHLRTDPAFFPMPELLRAATVRPAVELYPIISTNLQIAFGEVIVGTATQEQALRNMISSIRAQQ